MKKAKTPTTESTKKRSTPRLPADIKAGIAAALEKKATNIVVLDLKKTSAFTDYFVILTGGNVRHVQAIAGAIEEALKARGVKPALIEGYARAQWVLIDYFDVIFHVFTPSTREFYSLERLWGDATQIDIPA